MQNNKTIWQPSRTLQHETSTNARSTFRFCFIIHLLGRFQRTPLKSFSSINRTSDTSNIARHLPSFLCEFPPSPTTKYSFSSLTQFHKAYKVTNIPIWVWQPTVLLPPRKIVQINNNNIVHGIPWSNLAPPGSWFIPRYPIPHAGRKNKHEKIEEKNSRIGYRQVGGGSVCVSLAALTRCLTDSPRVGKKRALPSSLSSLPFPRPFFSVLFHGQASSVSRKGRKGSERLVFVTRC